MFKKNTEKRKKEKAFTLIELMLVVLVVGILAGIVTVSLSGIKKRNLERKVLVELSGVIQPLLTCISDGHGFWLPTQSGGAYICIDEVLLDATGDLDGSMIESYGNWPNLASDFPELYESNGEYVYMGHNCGSHPVFGGGICSNENDGDRWFISADLPGEHIVCCNARSEKCAIISGLIIGGCNNSIDL